MKKTILFLLLSAKLIAQPSGKLYVHNTTSIAYEGLLGYISYPSNVYTLIDSVYAFDFIVAGDSLFVADSSIYIYDLTSNTIVDSIQSVAASKIQRWNNSIVTLMQSPPYLRVYDLNTHSLSYSIDSTKISYAPGEILIENNLAYLTTTDSLIVVDLQLQDTVTRLFTPHPFPFAGMNQYIVSKDNFLYIVVNYATGAARFSLIQIDKSNYNVTTSFHYEGTECFMPPVLAEDSIFMTFYNSHYSISQDTFITVTNSTFNALEYDSMSHSMFIYNFSQNEISYDNNGILSTPVSLGSYVTKGIFVADLTSGIIPVLNSSLSLYPNPATDFINVNIKETHVDKIIIYDETGKIIYSDTPGKKPSEFKIDLRNYAKGNYFIRIISKEENHTKYFVIK